MNEKHRRGSTEKKKERQVEVLGNLRLQNTGCTRMQRGLTAGESGSSHCSLSLPCFLRAAAAGGFC